MSGGKRMGCSREKGNASHGVSEDILREGKLLEATETSFLSKFFEC